MSDYTKAVDFAAKDAAEDTFLGAEHDTEFTAIETAIATKANKLSPETNRVLSMDSAGDIQNSGIPTDEIGRLIDVKVYDTSGSHTWTKPSGCKKVEVEMVGAGAGSGAVWWTILVQGLLAASSGGAGGYLWARFDADDLGSTESVSVGAKGTGGSSSAPTNGGDSTFGSHATAGGGTAGTNHSFTTPISGGVGGTPVVNTTSEVSIVISGGNGDQGGDYGINPGVARSAKGGSSVLGESPSSVVAIVGVTASGGSGSAAAPGAAGSGAIRYVNISTVSTAGGDGADGIVIVKSYS